MQCNTILNYYDICIIAIAAALYKAYTTGRQVCFDVTIVVLSHIAYTYSYSLLPDMFGIIYELL